MPRRVSELETCPSGLGQGNMPLRVRDGETCFGGVGWVRLEINN